MIKYTCKKCNKIFEYGLVGPVYPGGKEKEEAGCPYCGTIAETSMTSQVYFVRPLDDNEKTEINTDPVS